MLLYEKEITIPISDHKQLLAHLKKFILKEIQCDEIPIRCVVTKSDDVSYQCELGVIKGIKYFPSSQDHIFNFKKRNSENTDQFNAVLLVPTGIGAEIGGHSGDGGPIARLLGSVCDNLITHPNVVNASDINEMPENALYVEGSVITRMLMGAIGLQKVRSNRVILVIDKHEDKFFHEEAINSLSAARAAFGLNCPEVVLLENNVLMRGAMYSGSGRAVGRIERFDGLYEALSKYRSDYDAVALSSIINVPISSHADYFKDDNMLNPWGGVEAMLTHTISTLFNVPSAHSPMAESRAVLDVEPGVVDPRKAAEAVSITYLHCLFKGLHKSPRIITDCQIGMQPGILDVSNISCLIIPDGCIGLPTLAALEQGIPVIAVKENKNRMKNDLEKLPFAPGKLFMVNNYWEAVGVMQAIKAGVAPESVRRPLSQTKIIEVSSQENFPPVIENNNLKNNL